MPAKQLNYSEEARRALKRGVDALADAPLVTLALDQHAAWIAEYYPTEEVAPRPDGGLVVTVRVSHPLWLEGMLLRLGGHARVLSRPGAGDSAVEVAREALDQYAALGLA